MLCHGLYITPDVQLLFVFYLNDARSKVSKFFKTDIFMRSSLLPLAVVIYL